MNNSDKKLTPVETIKANSNFLRGSLLEGLADTATGTWLSRILNSANFMGSTSRMIVITAMSGGARCWSPIINS